MSRHVYRQNANTDNLLPLKTSELAGNLVLLTFNSFQPNLFTFYKILKT